MTDIKDLCIEQGVIREDDSAYVQLYWSFYDDSPFFTTRVKNPKKLTKQEVEHIINAVNLFRTFK